MKKQILYLILLTFTTLYSGKPKKRVSLENNEHVELLNLFAQHLPYEDREKIFTQTITEFCKDYPGINNKDTNLALKFLKDAESKGPIIIILFLIQRYKDDLLIKYFLKPKNLHYCLKYDISILHIAAKYNRTKIINHLINNGVNINPIDQYGNTPLAIAEHYENKEAYELLSEHGALKEVKRKSRCPDCIIL